MKQLLLIICVLALGACTYEPKDVDNLNIPNYVTEEVKNNISTGIIDTVTIVETDSYHYVYTTEGKLSKRYSTDFTGEVLLISFICSLACFFIGLLIGNN